MADDNHKDKAASEYKHQSLSELLGDSPAIRKIKEQIGKVAQADIAVVLTGETGTGKELSARLIHQRSSRKNAPFVPLDCATIPHTIAESELFGYEKGAFTGADKPKQGLIETAHNGTLFLDEIANLPDALQSKLLRVIQESKVRRLGSQVEKEVDIRLLSASNQDLWEGVKKGNFRKDLFYRLNEFAIELPPLKDRKEDIPVFSQRFLKIFAEEFGKAVQNIAPEVMQQLTNYDWPGNVRELQNVLKSMVLMAEGDELTLHDLPENFIVAEAHDAEALENPYSLPENLKMVQHSTEKALIRKALEKTGGNKTETARLLEIDRKTLYTKMSQYNIFVK